MQALSQRDGMYGHEGADTIRTTCATKHAPAVGSRLHGPDYPSAEQVSPHSFLVQSGRVVAQHPGSAIELILPWFSGVSP
jgi:hypothetical protein